MILWTTRNSDTSYIYFPVEHKNAHIIKYLKVYQSYSWYINVS